MCNVDSAVNGAFSLAAMQWDEEQPKQLASADYEHYRGADEDNHSEREQQPAVISLR